MSILTKPPWLRSTAWRHMVLWRQMVLCSCPKSLCISIFCHIKGSLQTWYHNLHTFWAFSSIWIAPSRSSIDDVNSGGRPAQFRYPLSFITGDVLDEDDNEAETDEKWQNRRRRIHHPQESRPDLSIQFPILSITNWSSWCYIYIQNSLVWVTK